MNKTHWKRKNLDYSHAYIACNTIFYSNRFVHYTYIHRYTIHIHKLNTYEYIRIKPLLKKWSKSNIFFKSPYTEYVCCFIEIKRTCNILTTIRSNIYLGLAVLPNELITAISSVTNSGRYIIEHIIHFFIRLILSNNVYIILTEWCKKFCSKRSTSAFSQDHTRFNHWSIATFIISIGIEGTARTKVFLDSTNFCVLFNRSCSSTLISN